MDETRAHDFAREWIAAWNARDLDAVLAHYDDAVVFHSPRVRVVTGRDVDLVRGKAELRAYWSRSLSLAPALRFTLEAVLVGSDALTIVYTNHRAQRAAETFVFGADGRVTESVATYAALPADRAP